MAPRPYRNVTGGEPHAHEASVGLYRRGRGRWVFARRSLAGQARGPGQAAPGGDDIAGQVLRPAGRNAERQRSVQRRRGRAERGLSRRALEDAMGRFRREHQGREERGAAGGLHRRREVQTGAGPVPDRCDRAGRSVEERQRRRPSSRPSATSARPAAAVTTISARSSIPTGRTQTTPPRRGRRFSAGASR